MKDDFEYRDVPIGKFSVDSWADPLTQEIHLLVKRAAEQTQHEIIKTKSEHVRDRLYELGWIGPCDAVIVQISPSKNVTLSIACQNEDNLAQLKDIARHIERTRHLA